MTRAHFAGLNAAAFARLLEDHPVLISYADVVRRPGVWKEHILPRLEVSAYIKPILDSGAFTELTTPGFHVSVEEYAEFIDEYGYLFDQIVTLDDIGGDLARTWRNTERLMKTGYPIVPVFHGREPLMVLDHYCKNFGRVGLGFARDAGRISPDQGNGMSPDTWLQAALAIVNHYGVQVHGFGMTRYAMVRGHSRLSTSDSTTWIAEYRALNKTNEDGSHGVRGEARDAIEGLSKDGKARLSILSYYAQGAGEGLQRILEDSWGQARTVFRRFSSAELEAALDQAEA